MDHTNCDSSILSNTYTSGRKDQHDEWKLDTTAYSLDTTLPSMRDLGLDSLLNLHFSRGVTSPTLYASTLASVRLSVNPSRGSTALLFAPDRPVYVRVEVYDELGRMVVGDGSGRVYAAGAHRVPIELSGQASGVYYLRVSLGDGEFRTIKLVKAQ